MQTSDEILAPIDKKYPYEKRLLINNTTDNDIERGFTKVNQFILGVTLSDPMENGISHYEYELKRKLEGVNGDIKCFASPFKAHEVEEAKRVYREIANYYNIEVDADKMFQKVSKVEDERYYFIVVTILQSFVLAAK